MASFIGDKVRPSILSLACVFLIAYWTKQAFIRFKSVTQK